MKVLPQTTLFMLVSVDGKISTGDNDSRDMDKDLPKIKGVRDGLPQYYALEKLTDLHSFNTGRVMAKIGVNTRKKLPDKIPASFIIIDNRPHLTKKGVQYLTQWVKKLYLITDNKDHPAYQSKAKNLEIVRYNKKKFLPLFKILKTSYGIDKITVQSGGTLNTILIREGLIQKLRLIVAPCLIGGKNTSTLMDGDSLQTEQDLKHIKSLKLINCEKLKNSYLKLDYQVNL